MDDNTFWSTVALVGVALIIIPEIIAIFVLGLSQAPIWVVVLRIVGIVALLYGAWRVVKG